MSIFLIEGEGGESMAYATWQDVEARWRGKTFTADEQALATTLLEDAAVLIDAACSLTGTTPSAAMRKLVSARMVKRAMGGPEDAPGVQSVQQGAGPYQQTVQYAHPMGDVILTARDRRDLGCRPRAFSIDLLACPEDVESSSA